MKPHLTLGLAALLWWMPGVARSATAHHYVTLNDLAVLEAGWLPDGRLALTSRALDPGMIWDELVASWNVDLPPGETIEVQAGPVHSDGPSPFYSLGVWSSTTRHSVPAQSDTRATVRTDILALKTPGRMFRVRLLLAPGALAGRRHLRHVGFCLSGPSTETLPLLRPREVRLGPLNVPMLSQMSYPEGGGWCSPTCVAMLLGYWSERLARPDLRVTVPDAARGIHDPEWPGTGNWSFNMAYAGGFRGMRARVDRLSGMDQLVHWLEAGVPVAASVSNRLLQGKDRQPGDGHLIVVVGFDEGMVVVNDPGWSKEVRQRYPRGVFEQAWGVSRNTVYLLHPEDHPVPR